MSICRPTEYRALPGIYSEVFSFGLPKSQDRPILKRCGLWIQGGADEIMIQLFRIISGKEAVDDGRLFFE